MVLVRKSCRTETYSDGTESDEARPLDNVGWFVCLSSTLGAVVCSRHGEQLHLDIEAI